MLYLIWLNEVKKYIAQKYPEEKSWEKWATWRDIYLTGKSAAIAVEDSYEANLKKYA